MSSRGRTMVTLGGLPGACGGRRWWVWVGASLVVVVVAGWAFRALHDPNPWDTGLAYHAGQVAWASGHPEQLASWISMPLLGVVMMVASRVLGVRGVADAVTLVNVVLWVGACGYALARLRGRLSVAWWWVAALGLASFVPLMSSVWFKQFNVIALVLGALGFELVRRGRGSWAAVAIALSISVKPLLVLLPLVLLVRRDTRRVGVLSVVWVVGLDVAAQAVLATRAHDQLADLNPWIGVHNFLHKTGPNVATCLPLNYSPTSLLCRTVGGAAHWNVLRAAAVAGVALLALWIGEAVRFQRQPLWEMFAFTCALSVMVSPVEWTHYQIVLAPLFLLLLVRFSTEGATAGQWGGVLVAYVLTLFVWQPYVSLFTNVQDIVSHQPFHEPTMLEGLDEFAQYVLLITGALWYTARVGVVSRGPGSRAAV